MQIELDRIRTHLIIASDVEQGSIVWLKLKQLISSSF